jgi:hypothetical protein
MLLTRSRVLVFALLLIFRSGAAHCQSAVDPPSDAPDTVNVSNPEHRPFFGYKLLSVYVGQSFGYPQVLSDLDTSAWR